MLDDVPEDDEHDEIVQNGQEEEDDKLDDLFVLPETDELADLLELMKGEIVVQSFAAEETVGT